MHECLLCKRDMKVSNDVFGNGCVRNIYSFLDLQMPRKVNLREETLYKSIMRINKVNSLNKNQKIWLTERYLTYQYLNRIPYGNYNTIKNQINYDIQNIKQIKKDEEPKSAKNMSLKQAYDLYKKVIKFQDGIDKISKGKFTDEDSIKTIITSISFIFNMSKNKKQYEKNAFKGMQFAFWQTVIEVGGKYAEYPISAECLQHSLDENPEDLYITDGNIIETTTNSEGFYSFTKVLKGQYLVIFEYDTTQYGVTAFEKEGVSSEVNSNVITKNINVEGAEKKVAATEIVNISDSNIANIIAIIHNSIFSTSIFTTYL